jgi:hypothetical protein
MAKKRQMYVIGVLLRNGRIKYVTSIAEHHWARYESGKEAMLFTKETALDMCKGFAWNEVSAVPILYLDWITYKNPDEEDMAPAINATEED